MDKKDETIRRYETRLKDLVRAYKSLQREKEALAESLAALTAPATTTTTSMSLTPAGEADAAQPLATTAAEQGDDHTNSVSRNTSSQIANSTDDPASTMTEPLEPTAANMTLNKLMQALAAVTAEKEKMAVAYREEKKAMLAESNQLRRRAEELEWQLKMTTETKEIEKLKSALKAEQAAYLTELQRLRDSEQQTTMLFTQRSEEHHRQLAALRQDNDQLVKRCVAAEDALKRSQESSAEGAELTVLRSERDQLEARLCELTPLMGEYEQKNAALQRRVVDLQTLVDNLEEKLIHQSERDPVSATPSSTVLPSLSIDNDQYDQFVRVTAVAEERVAKLKRLVLAANRRLIDARLPPLDLDANHEDSLGTPLASPAISSPALTFDEKLQLETKIAKLTSSLQAAAKATAAAHQETRETLLSLQNAKSEHRAEISALEARLTSELDDVRRQLQRSRERALGLLEDRDNEIARLRGAVQSKMYTASPLRRLGLEVFEADDGDDTSSSVAGGMGTLPVEEHEFTNGDRHGPGPELQMAQTKINELTETIRELETRERQSTNQMKLLKEEVRRLERNQTRESVNLEYIKNVLVHFIESQGPQRQRLASVLATILQFSPAERHSVMESVKRKVSMA